jgi:hypothetical protein
VFHHNLWSNPSNGSACHFINNFGVTAPQWDSFAEVYSETYRTFTGADLDSLYAPQFNATIGQPLVGVVNDLHGATRPASGPWTVGAVELNPADPGDPEEPAVPGDVNGDLMVDVDDVFAVLNAWGSCQGSCPSDVTSDGLVNIDDLFLVIDLWPR